MSIDRMGSLPNELLENIIKRSGNFQIQLVSKSMFNFSDIVFFYPTWQSYKNPLLAKHITRIEEDKPNATYREKVRSLHRYYKDVMQFFDKVKFEKPNLNTFKSSFSSISEEHFSHMEQQLHERNTIVLFKVMLNEISGYKDNYLEILKSKINFNNKVNELKKLLTKDELAWSWVSTLNFNNVNLTMVQKEIETCKNISSLYLLNNNLSSLPDEVGKLSCLKILNLDYNNFKKIPNAVFKLSGLGCLSVSDNILTEISDDLTKLTSLKSLSLIKNPPLTSLSNAVNAFVITLPHFFADQTLFNQLKKQ